MTNATQNPGMPQAHALLIGVGSYTNHPGMNVSVYLAIIRGGWRTGPPWAILPASSA